jgi:hypothetical protein
LSDDEILSIKVLNAEVSDTTGDAINTAAGYKKWLKNFISPSFLNYI